MWFLSSRVVNILEVFKLLFLSFWSFPPDTSRRSQRRQKHHRTSRRRSRQQWRRGKLRDRLDSAVPLITRRLLRIRRLGKFSKFVDERTNFQTGLGEICQTSDHRTEVHRSKTTLNIFVNVFWILRLFILLASYDWRHAMEGPWQCDLIGRFFAFWASIQSQLQQLFYPNRSHCYAIFVKLLKSFVFLVKSFLPTFIDIWRFFTGHTGPWSKCHKQNSE